MESDQYTMTCHRYYNNKMSFVWTLKMLGTEFVVHPSSFVLHYAHQRTVSVFEASERNKAVVRGGCPPLVMIPYNASDDQAVLAHQPRACAQGLRRVAAVCCKFGARVCVLWRGAQHHRVQGVCAGPRYRVIFLRYTTCVDDMIVGTYKVLLPSWSPRHVV